MSEIQIADTNPPFVKALRLLRNGVDCPSGIISDLSALIVELSRKHFGITSEIMVEAARDGAVALISEGLILASGKNPTDLMLSDALKSIGIRGAVIEVTRLIKEITSDSSDLQSPSSVLFTFCNISSTRGVNVGHAYLMNQLGDIRRHKSLLIVKDWLLKNTAQGRILTRKRSELLEYLPPYDIVRSILLLYCGVKDNIEAEFNDGDEEPDSDTGYITVGPRLYKEARGRFVALLPKMPLPVRLALEPMVGKSWFDENVFTKTVDRKISVSPLKKKPAAITKGKLSPTPKARRKRATGSA